MVESKVAIVIPAYNEEKTIRRVISELRELLSEDIAFIVVNDCSQDETSFEAKVAGANVIDLNSNSGYALAIEAGLKLALAENYEFAVTVDADGQHPPSTVKEIIEMIQTGDWDLVLADRNERPRFGELVFCSIFKTFLNIPDPLCGLKAYRLDIFRDIAKFETFDSIGTELLVRYCLAKKRVNSSVLMKVRCRDDEPRFGSGLRINIRLLKSILLVIKFILINRLTKTVAELTKAIKRN
mgnify:CR=1 FL=1